MKKIMNCQNCIRYTTCFLQTQIRKFGETLASEPFNSSGNAEQIIVRTYKIQCEIENIAAENCQKYKE